MKFMSWLLTTSLVLPQFPAYAETNTDNVIRIDSNTLYLNNTANTVGNNLKLLSDKRDALSETFPNLGSVRDKVFSDVTKDHNLLNLQTGMTFWEEYQTLQNGDRSVIEKKYDDAIFVKLAARIKPKLLHFITWLSANGLSTLKSVMGNAPEGIIELEELRIKDIPYKADGSTYVITKYKDVVNALENPELFSVRNYHDRMKKSVGNFMLGNDKKAVNFEHPWARKLIDISEMETRIRPMIKSIFEEQMKQLEYIKRNPETGQLEGNIEVVNHIARRVPAILTIRYFGFEGISPEKIMEWSRATQDDFFHNITNDEDKATAAINAGKEMHARLTKLVDRKFAQVEQLAKLPREQQTILDRMVISIGPIHSSMKADDLLKKAKDKLYLNNFDDEKIETLDSATLVERIKGRIRTNIIGTLVGGIETTQAAIVQPLNLILSNPKLLADAQRLAAQAKNSRQDQQKFNNLVWEVLRFHPVNPVVFRFIEKDTEISGVPMKGGSHIIIATQAAMFDKEAFPEPDSIVLDRFANIREEKYFHLGYGHHRCLGDYVSMVQVPEIVAGILALPNIRKMPGAFGDLDFNKMTERSLLSGDSFDRSFPERMMLEYDSSDSRPLVQKSIEIQDHSVAFEGYLKDYDRNHFRGCMSGWNIIEDHEGQLLYSPNGEAQKSFYPKEPRFITKASDIADKSMLKIVKDITESKLRNAAIMASSSVRASQGFATNLREANNDLLYCRLPMKFHVCFESESAKIKKVFGIKQIVQDFKDGDSTIHAVAKAGVGNKQYEIRNQTEKGHPRLTAAHKTIYNKCAGVAALTPTEKAFYENRYFGKPINPNDLSASQAQRSKAWDDTFQHEDYFSAQPRYYYRGSFANPLGWIKMDEPHIIDFYVRLNFNFRMCIGGQILKRVERCEGYRACVNGTYNPLTFKYEGALSPIERRMYNKMVVADAPCE